MTGEVKFGVVLSAGGSAFETAFRVSGFSPSRFHVVSDRPCRAVERAAALGIGTAVVGAADNTALSAGLAAELRAKGCQIVLLHFSRLVTPVLFEAFPTFNVHPSLLPAFPGLDGVGDAARAGARYQGATLHLVDAGIDTGPIVAQTAAPVRIGAPREVRENLSYRQKVLVTLSLFDLVDSGRIDASGRGAGCLRLEGLTPGPLVNPGYQSVVISEAAQGFMGETA